MARELRYEGDDVTIFYDVKKCIHAAECVNGAPKVFNPDNKPWVDPDAAGAEKVVETIHRCPTGALTYERKDGGASEEPPAENTVRVAPDGPVYLRGDLVIEDAEGESVEEIRAALCRCGLSKNKPYCDNSHVKEDWKAEGSVGTAKAKDAPEGQSRLKARVLPSGPVLLEGPYRLLDAEGEVCLESGGGALCRCGRSSNKPFCDGAHKDAGFDDAGVFAR